MSTSRSTVCCCHFSTPAPLKPSRRNRAQWDEEIKRASSPSNRKYGKHDWKLLKFLSFMYYFGESSPCSSCAAIFFFVSVVGKSEYFQVTYFVILMSVSTAVFPHFVFNYAPTFTTPAKCENLLPPSGQGGVRSRLFGQENIMSCFFVGFFFLVHTLQLLFCLSVFFSPHRRMLLIKICNRPLSNWSLGSGQVSTHNNTLAIASFNHKPNMKRSARLRFFCPSCQ